MKVEKLQFEPTYKRGNGLFVVDLDKVEIPFEVIERSFVYIPPSEKGGNHRHPRAEAFIGIGEGLKVVWLDADGESHEETMNKNGGLSIYIISPNTPHAVINTSETQFGVLLEFASEVQHDVEMVNLV